MPSQRALNKAQHAFKKTLETEGPDAAQAALDKRGGQLPAAMKQRAQSMINDVRMNKGGHVPGYNVGGQISEEEKRRREKEMMRQRIASTQVQQQPLSPQQQTRAPGKTGGSMIAGIGEDLMRKALLGALGGPLGALFNTGGKVDTDMVMNGKFMSSHVPSQLRNMGGPMMPLNPRGYNEGGQAMETPMKRVMDEQKLEQQAMAFELEQKRKQETHEQAMKIKEQQAKQAAQMKKAAATTNKTASKPKGPLAK